MRRTAITMLSALLLAGCAPSLAQEADLPGFWLTDLDAARKQAKEEGRPLLVVFR